MVCWGCGVVGRFWRRCWGCAGAVWKTSGDGVAVLIGGLVRRHFVFSFLGFAEMIALRVFRIPNTGAPSADGIVRRAILS